MELEALLGELHEYLVECVSATLSVDLRQYEGRDLDALRGELIPITRALLGDAIAIGSSLLYAFDEERDEPSPRSADYAQVADLSFIAAMQFRQLTEVDRIRTITDPWELIAQCCSAHRCIARTLTMIEQPLARIRQVDARLDPMSEVRDAIEIRRQYARFARNVASHEAPQDDAELKRALRSIGTAIAILIGSDVYSQLRVCDRRHIRALQGRILDWLRGEEAAGGFIGGSRLWGDVASVSQMLMQINRREELIRHDSETIERLLALDDPESDREALRTLRGLDPALDRFLEGAGQPESKAEAQTETLREILERLSSALSVAQGRGGAQDENAPDPAALILAADPFANFEASADGARGA